MTRAIIHPRRAPEAPQLPRPVATPLFALDAWVTEGIITADQAALIRARESAIPTPVTASRPTLALEAAGYLGGVLVLVATMLLGFEFWDALSRAARLGLVGGAAVALFTGGAVVPARAGDVGIRLRSVLWLATTGVVAGFLALLAGEVLDLPADRSAVLTSSGAAAVALLLWIARPSPAQLVAAMVGPMVAAALAIADFSPSDALPGLGAWLVAAVWAVLAWGSLLPRRRLGLDLAAAGMIVAAMTTIPNDAGVLLALLTTAAVVAAAVMFRDVVLLVIGAMGTLNVLPAAITTWFPDTIAAPFALLAVGTSLVAMTLWGARRARGTAQVRRDWSSGSPRVAGSVAALLVAALVALLVTTAIVR
jgi:hypothetical protein